MLGQTLRKLQRNGIVTRRAETTMPMTVEYSLTTMGQSRPPIVDDLRAWSMANIAVVSKAQAASDRPAAKSRPEAAGSEAPIQERRFLKEVHVPWISVTRLDFATVDYLYLELDRHGIVPAEGRPA